VWLQGLGKLKKGKPITPEFEAVAFRISVYCMKLNKRNICISNKEKQTP
jgi:hypothetical protein